MNPDGSGSFVGNLDLARENKGALIDDSRSAKKRKVNKRENKGSADDVDGIIFFYFAGFLGPWAKYEDLNQLKNPEVDDAVYYSIYNTLD